MPYPVTCHGSDTRRSGLSIISHRETPWPRIGLWSTSGLSYSSWSHSPTVAGSGNHGFFWVDKMYGTILAKTGTILFRTLQYGLRFAEFSINLSPKNPQIAPFGAVSRHRIGLYYPKLKRTPFLTQDRCFSPTGTDVSSGGGGVVWRCCEGTTINLRAELLFMMILSDGEVITGLPLKHGPGLDAGHNSTFSPFPPA